MNKLTMITVNGRTRFVQLPVVDGRMVETEENVFTPDVKVRIDRDRLFAMFGIRRGDFVRLGR